MTIILGIDPGSRKTGFGLIRLEKKTPIYITSGCIKTEHKLLPPRLAAINTGIEELIRAHGPDSVAVEQVFFHQNPNSALKLGQARGAAIVAAARANIEVAEYSARQIKQAVVGYGAADKAQVATMVKSLLNIHGNLQEDAADGLAAALCHAQSSRQQVVTEETNNLYRWRKR